AAPLRLAAGSARSPGQAPSACDPSRRRRPAHRAARRAGRQCRTDGPSDRRAGFQSRPARCADPGRTGRCRPRSWRSRLAGTLRRPPGAGSRSHHGDEPRPGAIGLFAATAAGAGALAGPARLRPAAAVATRAGSRRHGFSRRATAGGTGAPAMNARAGELSSRRRAPAVDVAVVGGGMVGAAAALALARAGFRVALLEARAPEAWSARDELDLRVVGLAPSSLALLDDLAVWTSIRDARACLYTHMHVWDAESGAAIDFDAAGAGRAGLGYIVENSLIQWTLWQALPDAGTRQLCPAEVTGFEAAED